MNIFSYSTGEYFGFYFKNKQYESNLGLIPFLISFLYLEFDIHIIGWRLFLDILRNAVFLR